MRSNNLLSTFSRTHFVTPVRVPAGRRDVLIARRLNQIAVSDPARLEGLTQFPFSSRHAHQQTLERQDISNRICVKGLLRYPVPDRPQAVDSKAERCRSGRSSTLGNRLRTRVLTHTKSHLLTSESTTSAATIRFGVSP